MNTRRNFRRFNIQNFRLELSEGMLGAFETSVAVEESVELEPSTQPFDRVCQAFKKEMDENFEKVKSTSEGKEIHELEEAVSLLKPAYVTTLLEKIDTFISDHQFKDIPIPRYYANLNQFCPEEQRKYSNLAHAVLHELYGWNELAHWLTKPRSYAMQVIDKYIWIYDPSKGRNVLMNFELRSKEQISKIIRSLVRHKENAVVNQASPTLELDLYTGERVQILIEPRMRRSVITFRRMHPEYVTLQDQMNSGMFPKEDLPIYQGIAHSMANTVISGPMGTRKTSFLRALIHERPDHIGGFGIEEDYELHISTINPRKKFIEFILNGSSFVDALKNALRTDARYGVIQEVRMHEAEGAMDVAERLQKGLLTTTHIWRAETIPEQWGRLIVRNNGGGDLDAEKKRVAEYIDLIILLGHEDLDETEEKKRVMSVQELRYNRFNGEISTHQILRFNHQEKKYEYRFDLSEQLLNEMSLASRKWTDVLVNTLKKQAERSPIPEGEGVTIFNPAIANPEYRLALATEKLVQEQKRTGDMLEALLKHFQQAVG